MSHFFPSLKNIFFFRGIVMITSLLFSQKAYWLGKATSIRKKEESQVTNITHNAYFEDEPVDLVAGIMIQHLYKVLFTDLFSPMLLKINLQGVHSKRLSLAITLPPYNVNKYCSQYIYYLKR